MLIPVMTGFKEYYYKFQDLKNDVLKTGGIVELSYSDLLNQYYAVAANSYGRRTYLKTLNGWEIR